MITIRVFVKIGIKPWRLFDIVATWRRNCYAHAELLNEDNASKGWNNENETCRGLIHAFQATACLLFLTGTYLPCKAVIAYRWLRKLVGHMRLLLHAYVNRLATGARSSFNGGNVPSISQASL